MKKRVLVPLFLQLILQINLIAQEVNRDIWDKFFEVPHLEDSLLHLGISSNKTIDENHINILVWNMYKGKNPSWTADFQKLAEPSDILLLQEVYWQNPMEQSFAKLDLSTDMAVSFVLQKTLDPTGVANASKSHILETKIFRSTFKETLAKTPKMIAASYVKLNQSHQSLLVVNIHGVNFVAAHALGHQLLEVSQLIKNHQGPVVFAGDFNTWTKDKTALVFNMMKKLNMKEVTFAADNRKKTFGYPLDHIFYRDLKVIESISYGDILGSDHTPMRAIFTL